MRKYEEYFLSYPNGNGFKKIDRATAIHFMAFLSDSPRMTVKQEMEVTTFRHGLQIVKRVEMFDNKKHK